MRRFTALLAGLLLSLTALAGGSEYALGVKGLACPFCAYGIEKRLYKIEAVEDITVKEDVDSTPTLGATVRLPLGVNEREFHAMPQASVF